MKVVGKIGMEPTILETSSASGNFVFNFSLFVNYIR